LLLLFNHLPTPKARGEELEKVDFELPSLPRFSGACLVMDSSLTCHLQCGKEYVQHSVKSLADSSVMSLACRLGNLCCLS